MKRKSNTSDMDPAIGMGVTIYYHSDSQAGTIIQITSNGRKIVIQEDTATRTDDNGASEIQSYEYSPNSNGATYTATRRRDGKFRLTGSKTLVALGFRRQYYDFSF